MSELRFIPPPTAKSIGRRAKYMTDEVCDALDARPGEWALLIEGAPRMIGAVATWCKNHDAYESTTRSHDSVVDIYVRRRP